MLTDAVLLSRRKVVLARSCRGVTAVQNSWHQERTEKQLWPRKHQVTLTQSTSEYCNVNNDHVALWLLFVPQCFEVCTYGHYLFLA